MHTYRSLKLMTLAAVALAVASCTVSKTPAPQLTGPSELSMSLAVTATPDLIAADGSSKSVIDIVARDANGQARPNVQLRVDTVTGGDTIVDVGQLSTRTVTTGSNGQASVTFTAPMESVPGVDVNGTVSVRVVAISSNFGGEAPRYVTIRLVPKTIVIAPGAPVPSFTFNPTSPIVNERVLFNASGSYDPDGSIVAYTWEWGDSDPPVIKTTATEDHDFAAAGTYYVKLTVTDNAGQQSFVVKPIIVK